MTKIHDKIRQHEANGERSRTGHGGGNGLDALQLELELGVDLGLLRRLGGGFGGSNGSLGSLREFEKHSTRTYKAETQKQQIHIGTR